MLSQEILIYVDKSRIFLSNEEKFVNSHLHEG